MRPLHLAGALVVLVAVAATTPAQAFEDPAPGSVSAGTVKLPSAPGSLEGLGQAGEVSVFTGQYGYSIPLDLPAGQAGFGPSLALSYDGGLGNSVVGLGWGFSAPHIQRSTRFGIPAYDESDELELVGIGGGGRLVKLTCGPFTNEYRVEGHGQSVRVQASGPTADPTSFTVTTADGTIYQLDRRVTNPNAGQLTFAWYVSEIRAVDEQPSQTVVFTYTNANPTLLGDPTTSPGHPLLTRLEWGPTPASGPGAGARAFRADFVLEARPDPTESYRTGFWRILRHRLNRVVITSFGEVRKTYEIEYDPDFAISRVASVTITGRASDPIALPTISFAYGEANPTPVMAQITGAGGWNLAERGVSIQDVDQDGLVDLARFEFGNREWRKNEGGTFSDELSLPGGGEWDLDDTRLMDLDADMRPEMVYIANDTWRVYRLTTTPSDPEAPPTSASCEPAAHAWTSVGEWPGTFMVPLAARDTVFADFDGDERVDVLSASTTGTIMRWADEGGLGEPEMMPLVSDADSFLEPGDDNLQFMDMNGDGLTDAVWLADGWIKVYPGLGNGTFETRAVRHCYPWNWQGEADDGPTLTDPTEKCRLYDTDFIDFANIRLVDLDRDGMQDLVRVSAGYVHWYPGYWFADAQDGSLPFAAPVTLPRPEGALYDDVVTFADMNGNGSQDVVWSSQFGLYYLDLAGPATRGMLTEIHNGLGAVTQIAYTTTALTQLAACDADTPWVEAFPVNMVVPSVVTTVVPGEPDRRAISIVRDGFWDLEERKFGGFLGASQVADAYPHDADFDAKDLVSTIEFERGEGTSRVLRGMPFRTVRSDGTGKVFDEVIATHDARTVTDMACGDAKLRVPVTTTQFTVLDERMCAPEHPENRKYLKQESEYDGYGNVTKVTNLGEVSATGEDLPDVAPPGSTVVEDHDDETVATTAYVSNWTDWVLFKPCEQTVQTYVPGSTGDVLAKSATVYESTTAPASACSATANDGRVRGAYGWLASESRWVKQSDATFDTVGNPTNVYASGVRRELTWDADKLFPMSEAVVGSDWLQWDIVAWDKPLGAPIEAKDMGERRQKVELDGLGRVTGTFAGQWQADQRLTTTEYVLTGEEVVPRIETIVHEGGAIPDVESAAVFNAIGEPRYSAVRDGPSSWIIDGHRYRNELGLTTEVARPYPWTGVLPPTGGIPNGQPRQTVEYDPMRRAVRQVLPAVPRHGSVDPVSAEKTSAFGPLTSTVTSTEMAPVTTINDGLGRLFSTSRSVLNPWTSVVVDEEVQAKWDAAGRMTSWIVNPGATEVEHTFVYDTLGRLISGADPDAGPRSHTWTDGNQLISTTNDEDDVVSYTYDGAGRLATRTGTSATTAYDETWTFWYDVWVEGDEEEYSPGSLVAVTGPDSHQRIFYDALGRVSADVEDITAYPDGNEIVAGAVTNDYTYSLSGKLLQREVTGADSSITVEYDYDPAGRMRWIGWSTGGGLVSTLWEALELAPSGATLRERMGNGLGTDFGRDVLDQVNAVTVRDTDTTISVWNRSDHAIDGTALEDYRTAYDASSTQTRYGVGIERNAYGAIRAVADTAPVFGQLPRNASFEYDGAARLTRGVIGVGDEDAYDFKYEYDALQNMVRREQVAPATVIPTMLSGIYAHGDGNTASRRQLTAVGTTSFDYDHAGRMTKIEGPTGDTTMVFDAFDRLREVHDAGTVTTHKYGPDGERIATKWGTGGVERYFGAGLSERRPEGAASRRLELHVGLGGPRLVASLRDPVSGGDEPVVYLTQGVGPGPAVVSDMTGVTVEERYFEPYGSEIAAYRSEPTWMMLPTFKAMLEPNGWNAKPIDPTTRWADYGARWLGTAFASWLSVDPALRVPSGLGAQGLAESPFGHTLGNPVSMWDPDGRFVPLLLFVGAVAKSGAVAGGAAAVAGGTAVVVGGVALGTKIAIVGVGIGIAFGANEGVGVDGVLDAARFADAVDDLAKRGAVSAYVATRIQERDETPSVNNPIVLPGIQIRHGGRVVTIPPGATPDDHGTVMGRDADGNPVMLNYEDVREHLDPELWHRTVDFAGSDALFPVEGTAFKNTVTIKYTGSRDRDFTAAWKAAGFRDTKDRPSDYVWHHVADYNPWTNEGTMQLVRKTCHRESCPHSGGVSQYEKHWGVEYK